MIPGPSHMTTLGNYGLETPAFFSGVSQWYQDFRPTTDAEVDRLLADGD